MASGTAEETTTSRTPLLSSLDVEHSAAMEPPTSNNHNSNHEQELQFYDHATVLDVSRDVAFGYLILLTGGAADYAPPTPEEARRQSTNETPPSTTGRHDVTHDKTPGRSRRQSPVLDEEAASLAYAAIVDGNVLHACFGLRPSPNGRVSDAVPIIGQKNKESSSLFCCLPKSRGTLDALQMVLPHLTMNKLKMQNLVEILREVRDLHMDALETNTSAAGLSKQLVYVQVIQGYINCFSSVVRYHDSVRLVEGDPGKSKRKKERKSCCPRIFDRLFSKKGDPRRERLRDDALHDIEEGFRGVRVLVWESLERMASETAFTGVSIEE